MAKLLQRIICDENTDKITTPEFKEMVIPEIKSSIQPYKKDVVITRRELFQSIASRKQNQGDHKYNKCSNIKRKIQHN